MNCQHDNRRAYSYAFGRRQTVMCSECLAAASATGLPFTLLERRQGDQPHSVERRRSFRPAWLRNLTASDRTDYAA